MWVQFKEKTYETYFQTELGRLTNVSFAPDQSDEGTLGFDGAFFLEMAILARHFPIMPRHLPLLAGMTVSDIDSFGRRLNDRLPPFKLNLFVQYKRPEWLSRSNAAEWPSWNEPYFRYSADKKQQGLLEKIAASAHGRAAVVYAAPAFWKATELFQLAQDGLIVERSNIAEVAQLSGHSRFSYKSAGNAGIGHSDPEPVESEPFEAILRRGEELEPLPFTRHLKMLDELIRNSLEKEPDSLALWESARDAILGGPAVDTVSRTRGTWIDAIVSMIAFSQAFDTRISALG